MCLGFSLCFDNVTARTAAAVRLLLDGPGTCTGRETNDRQQQRLRVHRGGAAGAGRDAAAAGAATALVPRVRPHVARDHVPPAGRVRTLRALVRLLAGVGPLVGRPVGRKGKNGFQKIDILTKFSYKFG